ncbi:lipopolysaccharide biosynthesis protein [Escherichia coli]|nr:lipopolysaccharide biosynthesis protein [Escherichia coli]EIZ9746632.1 lipopolysaccharide biosynthesis protein [Escherichia coli]EJK1468137.1 lipopolysaccharide biosynthesis protein [Escherichia coli]EJK4331707.1 lipopolysaccharide biosynthesis protein [Escherichia coli]EJO8109145.1 lipopolysaccharide biosynthesis protein [Escherichia coli]
MKAAKTGLFWSALERVLTQAIQLAIMLVLARRLGPEAFGLIGMVAIFLSISQVFVDSGFSNAIIRKKERSEKDYSTVFIFNFTVSIICYGALWLLAPFIADFYRKKELVDIIRILGTIIPINALSVVQRIRLTVALDFKKLAISSSLGAVISGAVAIFIAYRLHQGVWSLVYQSLTFSIVSTLVLNILNPWSPKEKFSKESFLSLFGFGSKLLVASIIETILSNIYTIIIGRKYEAQKLGLYTQANQLASVPAITMTNILQRVTFPLLSNIQDDIKKLDETYLFIIKSSCSIIFPLLSVFAILSMPLLTSILGNIWWESSVLLSILICGYLLYPLHAINLNMLQVKGRSDLFLKLEIIKKIGMLAILLITINYGVVALCIGISVSSYFSLIMNTLYTGRLSSITFSKQISSVFFIWLICIVFIIISLAINYYVHDHTKVYLISTGAVFIFVYISYMVFMQKNLVKMIISYVKK